MKTLLPFIIYKGTKVYPGHPCHVAASPGKRNGYDTLVRAIWGFPESKSMEVEVVHPYSGNIRTYPVTCIRPYLRNVEGIRNKILADRRKRLGLSAEDVPTKVNKRKKAARE